MINDQRRKHLRLATSRRSDTHTVGAAAVAASLAFMPRAPVKARLVFRSEEWEWSNARTHAGLSEGVVTSNSFLPHLSDFIIRRLMQHVHA
jgi:hypothetical protein